MKISRLFPIWFFLLSGVMTDKATAGEIVATVPAIASIIENITFDRTDAVIGKNAGGCVHDYHLKPSDAVKIGNAKLIVTVGRGFEPFFDTIIKLKKSDATVIELDKTTTMRLWPARTGEKWHEHHHHSHEHEHHGEENEHDIDHHLWLDPENAIRIAETAANAASGLHPEKKDFYRRNLEEFTDKIKKLTAKTLNQTKNKRRYMVSHDSLQYLERFFDLDCEGAISDLESGEISIKKALSVEKAIKENDVSLLLIVGNVYPQSLNRLKKENGIEIKTVDVLGTTFTPGKDLYFKMLENIIDAIQP